MSKLTTFNMPLGPVHVALEEPVYFNLTVEGETIRKVELTYRTGSDLYFMPYYRFYVEIPQEQWGEMKTYGAY